jgi:hypothetical protein
LRIWLRQLGHQTCGGIELRCYDGTDDSHHTVEADGDAIAGPAMCCGQDFRSVGVEAAVVDVLKRDVSNTPPSSTFTTQRQI